MKKPGSGGSFTKQFILIGMMISVFLLSACSLIERGAKQEEAVRYITPAVQEEKQPDAAKTPEEILKDIVQSDSSPAQEVEPSKEAEGENPSEPEASAEAPITTDTPDSTEASESTDASKPIEASKPTDASKPTEAAKPTEASKPTEAPKSTEASKPTEALKPTVDPRPTEAPKPTATPKPTAVPKPTEAPKPTVAPKPTAAPKPTTKPLPSGKDLTSMEAYADELLKSIITKGMSEVEKVKAVHDYIVLHTAYYENPKLRPEDYPAEVFQVEGVLLNGSAVCQGYAETFQLFMDRLGINCKVVVGKELVNLVGHAWNMVELDGKWYHVDTTWDDPVPDQKGRVQYKYFLITDEMLAEDHYWIKGNYPACDSKDYLYYIYEDNMISSIEKYEEKFIELYIQGERTITILYPEEGRPDLSFFFDYDYLHKVDADGTKRIAYKHYPTWRRGNYTVYTVIVD